MNCSCLQSQNGDVNEIMVQNIKSVYDEKGLNVTRQHLENDIVDYAEANEFEWRIHHVKVLNSSELGETSRLHSSMQRGKTCGSCKRAEWKALEWIAFKSIHKPEAHSNPSSL